MPRRVDYASRFDFLREAAFAIVRDRGVEALSRRALADELGIARNAVRALVDPHVDLVGLAAQEAASRRQAGRRSLPRGAGRSVALLLVGSTMTSAWSRIDEELVWLRIELARATRRSPVADPEGPLRDRIQIAERGYVRERRDDLPVFASQDGATAEEAATAKDAATPEDMSTPVKSSWPRCREDREKQVTWALGRALEEIGLDGLDEQQRAEELVSLRALADGLTWAVCTGRLDPDQAMEVIGRHLERITRPA